MSSRKQNILIVVGLVLLGLWWVTPQTEAPNQTPKPAEPKPPKVQPIPEPCPDDT